MPLSSPPFDGRRVIAEEKALVVVVQPAHQLETRTGDVSDGLDTWRRSSGDAAVGQWRTASDDFTGPAIETESTPNRFRGGAPSRADGGATRSTVFVRATVFVGSSKVTCCDGIIDRVVCVDSPSALACFFFPFRVFYSQISQPADFQL